MDHLQAVKADRAVELLHHLRVEFRGPVVVAGGEDVAGVETDSHPLVLVDALDDGSDFLERAAERGPLTGSRFEQCDRPVVRNRSVDLVERLGEPFDPGFHSRPGVGTGVRDEVGNAKFVAAFKLIGEGRDRLGEDIFLGRRKVDQVGIVDNKLVEADASAFDLGPKLLDDSRIKWFCLPLTFVLRENLDRFRSDIHAALGSAVDAARSRDVRAKCQHHVRYPSAWFAWSISSASFVALCPTTTSSPPITMGRRSRVGSSSMSESNWSSVSASISADRAR